MMALWHALVLPLLIAVVLTSAEWAVRLTKECPRRSLEEEALETTSLRKTISECQTNLREKDRAIQCQRETIERLEQRVAADTRSIKGQLNMIKIKDSILVSKNRLTKELNDEMAASYYTIRNLQWDVESLHAQIEEKDKVFWVVTGRGSNALKTIWALQDRLEASTKLLKFTAKAADVNSIGRMEDKYVKTIGQLSEKLDDAEKRLRRETADAKELRTRIANDVPHYVECIKVKDVALRNAEAMLKSSGAWRKTLLDEKANSHYQKLLETANAEIAARDTRIAEYESKSKNDSETDRRALANNLAKVRGDHHDTIRALARSNQALLRLTKRYESDMKAAASEHEDLQTQISTLYKELSECKGRLTAVNTKILDRETELTSALEAKANLETELKASTTLAEENSQHLCFARHALDSAINQLKALNSEYNTQKLAKQRFESAFNASQKSTGEFHTSMQAQRDNANSYAHQLLKTEERYKESKIQCIGLQNDLNTSKAQVADLQAKLQTSNKLASNHEKAWATCKTQVSHLQDKLTFSKALAKDLQTVWNTARTKAVGLQKQLDASASASLAAKSQERAARPEKTSINLEASLAAVQEALRNESSALRSAQREAETCLAIHVKALANAKDRISTLESQASESENRSDKEAQRLREATQGRFQAVYKLDQARRLIHMLRRKNAQLKEELGEESRAREEAEGYIEVEEVYSEDDEGSEDDDGDDVESVESIDSEYRDEGDDEDDEEEVEFENVELIVGREPIEGEQGFQFVETE